MSWATSNCDNVWIEVPEELKDTLCSEFLPIVCMKIFWIPNESKYLLELVGNQMCLFPWQSTDMGEASGMILESHDPTHQDTKGITFPEPAKVNKINLESIPETFGEDWLD